ERGILLHAADAGIVTLSLDEPTADDVRYGTLLAELVDVFAPGAGAPASDAAPAAGFRSFDVTLERASAYLTHPVFNTHHSETAMMRYLKYLADKDYALDRGMIPLGSCTMKLNAATEMEAVTWPEFAGIHPFAPAS